MKSFIGLLLCAIGLVGALYISVWWGIIQPIYSVCMMVDAHTVTAMSIAGEVVKFLVRDFIAVIWFAVFWFIGTKLIED
jgi:hypothetical protein